MRFNKFLNEHTKMIVFFGLVFIVFALLFVPHYNKHKEPIIIDNTLKSELVVASHSIEPGSLESLHIEQQQDPDISGNDDVVEKININTATATQLETLPGIGPSFSKRIIDYREQRGEFYDIRELTKIPGIGAKRFGDIQDLICVE